MTDMYDVLERPAAAGSRRCWAV